MRAEVLGRLSAAEMDTVQTHEKVARAVRGGALCETARDALEMQTVLQRENVKQRVTVRVLNVRHKHRARRVAQRFEL